jgi:hypothetical protein
VLRNAGPARGSAYKKGEWREGVHARWVSGEGLSEGVAKGCSLELRHHWHH